ncbi:MAG: 3-methyl-2-oxobutanoate hydroxymethyltransferase [Gracilibacteraceae bacterium]|jgi:3-methyl-2-oxobutanoate hydroxymethyltransferase|nr:3-methyl-2-oxobutanoate hydroxymethyltransferase [Gracilibacteraceae bacterium]
MKKTAPELRQMAADGEKITMITAYDYPSARAAAAAGVDTILVGDSLGMVVLGYDSTVPVTMEDMLHHLKAARRGAPQTFIICDLPFMSCAESGAALRNSARLMKEGGADAVKLEGGEDWAPIVRALTKAGAPVVGHIGLTPQTAGQLGGFKVQGRDLEGARQLLRDALALEEAGAIMIVLEATPAELAATITEKLQIPTIGIGAGPDPDGQVLVYHDLLGMFDRFTPKFVKQYALLEKEIVGAVKAYCQEVKEGVFPDNAHSFSMREDVLKDLLETDAFHAS